MRKFILMIADAAGDRSLSPAAWSGNGPWRTTTSVQGCAACGSARQALQEPYRDDRGYRARRDTIYIRWGFYAAGCEIGATRAPSAMSN